jgi:mycothiol system anti-sigma-R factor
MNIINIEAKICERIRRRLDAYLSNELSGGNSIEVARHLEACPKCVEEHTELRRVRVVLRHAVDQETAPSSLRARIQGDLRAVARPHPLQSFWIMAVAATVLISLGGYFLLIWKSRHQLNDINPQLAAVLGVGLDDHIHCTSGSWYQNRLFTDEQVAANLGQEYAGLAPLIKSKLPENTQLVVGHSCRVNGREFIHFILRQKDQTASLIVTLKRGETYPDHDLATQLPSGIRLHEARMKNFEVTGFEMSSHLIYVISNLAAGENRQLAGAMAAPVLDYLIKRI